MPNRTTLGILVVLSYGLSVGCSSVHSYTQNSNRSPSVTRNRAGTAPLSTRNSNRPTDGTGTGTAPTWIRNSNRTEVIIIPRPQENESIILFEPAKGQPIKVKFTKDEVSDFAALLKTKNAEEVKKVVDSISATLKEARVDCCEKKEKVSSCEWQCCDGSKVTTCNRTLNQALTYLWPAKQQGR
jgi:hypothetical protein